MTLCLIIVCIDTKPTLQASKTLSENQVRLASKFARRVSKQMLTARRPVTVSASENELNSAFTLIHYSYPQLAGNVSVSATQAEFAASLSFTPHRRTYYINVSALLAPSVDAIRWRSGRIGNLNLNSTLANFLFRRVTEHVLGGKYADNMLASVSAVKIQNASLQFDFTPRESFHEDIANTLNHLTKSSGKSAVFTIERVQYYLDFITTMTRALPAQQTSLSYYLHKIVSEAKQQRNNRASKAEEESTAALFALAVAVAPDTFKHFVPELNIDRVKLSRRPVLTISGRQDLALHFIYSATFKILSNNGVSFSLGEMKEILDASGSGSGFSFADLAADKSGIKFADFALAEESAVLLQERAANSLKEQDFFPLIKHLPEGLNSTEFQKHYTTTQSASYKKIVAGIDKAINQSALYYTSDDFKH